MTKKEKNASLDGEMDCCCKEEGSADCGCGERNESGSDGKKHDCGSDDCGCDCGGEGHECKGGGCCGEDCGDGELTLSEQVDFLSQQLEIAQVIINREKQKTEEIGKLNDRMKTEFDNYRSRNRENIEKAEAEGAAKVFEKLLPVLDSLDQAKSMIKDRQTIEGLDIISRQIGALLTSFGVEEIAALGEEFDPNFHDCVSQVKAKRKEDKGKVVGVMRKGYKAGERIIRHSAVTVAQD